MKVKRFSSSEECVWKYVFDFDGKVAEAVLYRYNTFEDRTVICCSVSSGCQIGCKFCGTGDNFIGHLNSREIIAQISYIIKDQNIPWQNCKKFQIMFMSMGEPFLNYAYTTLAIFDLNHLYPNAQLLISTIAPKNIYNTDFLQFSKQIPAIGLQFSIHASTNEERDSLIPFKAKLTLEEITQYGERWAFATGRKSYLNYCVTKHFCDKDIENLHKLFSPNIFCITLSVLCANNETQKDAGYRNLNHIYQIQEKFLNLGYNVRTFDPHGQDDIGGGCGQLFFVQRILKGQTWEEACRA